MKFLKFIQKIVLAVKILFPGKIAKIKEKLSNEAPAPAPPPVAPPVEEVKKK